VKVLIVGYGSIGKRHDEVLSSFAEISEIHIVTKQKIDSRNTFLSLESVQDIQKYDYFVIASETSKHFQQLKYLEENVEGKIIFCEKPIFAKYENLEIKNNKIFVGYVLRFHPLLEKLKIFLETEKVISANVFVGQYLPTWRENIDYRNSYSAKKSEGGGVLKDLSHEIDYIQWLFGELKEIKSYQLKISDLEIDSDDYSTFIGMTENGIVLNVSMDYISKITKRNIIIHTFESSYELDFIKNTLIKVSKDGLEENFSFANLERNYMFEKMHRNILFENASNNTSYNEALDVMRVIDKIEKENS
jgi:predicted dehydrogenase